MEQFRQYVSGLISGNTQLFQSDMNTFLVMKITMNIFMQKQKKKKIKIKQKQNHCVYHFSNVMCLETRLQVHKLVDM